MVPPIGNEMRQITAIRHSEASLYPGGRELSLEKARSANVGNTQVFGLVKQRTMYVAASLDFLD